MSRTTCYRCGSADNKRRALVVFSDIKVEKCISTKDCDLAIVRALAAALDAAIDAIDVLETQP